MPHPAFDDHADDPASASWWRVLRDLGIAMVVVVAAALIGGFLLLPPVHAGERAAPVPAGQGASQPPAPRGTV